MNFLKNKNFQLKLAAILIFATVSLIFSYPALQGKVLDQHDIRQSKGNSSEIKKYREDGRQILWTNSLFSGMPANLISVVYDSEWVRHISKVFKILPHPVSVIFSLMIGFYVLLLSLKVDLRVAIIGGIAYGLSSYYLVYLVAGHNTKVQALAYLPGILAGLIWLYRDKKVFLGLGLLTLFFALEIQARHPQMLYYMLFVLIFYVIYQLIEYIKAKEIVSFFKISLIALIGIAIGVASSYSYLKNTMNYGKKSIRGKSELTLNSEDKTATGLDRTYVTRWSYGVSESFSLLVPNFKGGESKAIGKDNKALESIDRNLRQAIAGQSHYWGDQPLISGPAYAGAFIFFLAFLGIFLVKSRVKYVFLVGTIFTMALAWGKNFPEMTNFFLDHFPYYSKFRAVSSMMVIPLLLIPALGMLALNALGKENIWDGQTSLFGKMYSNKKVIWVSFSIISGFCLLGYIMPDVINSFLSIQEEESLGARLKEAGFNAQQSDSFIESLVGVRKAIFKTDVLRSLGILVGGGLLMWLYSTKKLGRNLFIGLIGVLIILDLFSVDRRYMNEDKFVNSKKLGNNYGVQMTAADQQILRDTDPHYRVLNLTVSPFNDATTSFYHKSIGGYHGAKMKIYQDFVEYQITPDLSKIQKGFSQSGNPDQVFANTNALNMLNAKYLIVSANQAVRNPRALGNAWFVNKLNVVENADKEIIGVGSINPANEVIIRESLAESLKAYSFGKDSLAAIKLTSYDPEKMVYKSNNSQNGFAVFSEVYYANNWKAYVDGEEQEIIRTNYVLRGLKVPAGKHEIVFKYQDDVYQSTASISLIGSILVLLGVPILFFMHYKKEQKKQDAA